HARVARPPAPRGARRPLVRRVVDGHVGRLRSGDRGGGDDRAGRPSDLRRPRAARQSLLARRGSVTEEPASGRPPADGSAADRGRLDRDAFNPLPVDVISIQSQVAYGCVGNSVAVPTLQALGLNVVALPTGI